MTACRTRWTQFRASRDDRERERLIDAHLHLVKMTARRALPFAHSSVEWVDLLAAGRIGLVKAVDRYDPSLGNVFETLAISLIRGAIREWLRSIDPLPRTCRDRIRDLDETREALAEALGRTPTDAEIMDALGWDEGTLKKTRQGASFAFPVSLDVPTQSSMRRGEDLVLSDTIPSEEPDPFSIVLSGARSEALHAAIGKLPKREREVVTAYYLEGKTTRETAEAMDLSQSRVSQLLTQALSRLRVLLTRSHSLFEDD